MTQRLEDYIVVLGQALPESLCEAVLDEFRDATDWNASLIGTGQVDRRVRDADAISMSERAVIDRNRTTRRRLDEQLHRHCAAAVQQYSQRFAHCRISRDSGFELLRYRPGGHYQEHTDSRHAVQRELACSFQLNDDFDGGEWAFFGGRVRLRPGRGAAILFPANFMYPHQILPVTRGVRYSIVTWFT